MSAAHCVNRALGLFAAKQGAEFTPDQRRAIQDANAAVNAEVRQDQGSLTEDRRERQTFKNRTDQQTEKKRRRRQNNTHKTIRALMSPHAAAARCLHALSQLLALPAEGAATGAAAAAAAAQTAGMEANAAAEPLATALLRAMGLADDGVNGVPAPAIPHGAGAATAAAPAAAAPAELE